jgi:replicative DNA helicase
MLRQIITAATQIVAMGYDAPDDLDEVVADAEKLIFDVTNKRVSSNFRGIPELLRASFEQMEELFERKEHVTGVPTGFKEIDKTLAGLHPGDLIILAARPSVGKTAFALNVAVNAAKAGAAVAVFSLEMSSEQLVQRVLCSEARINLADVRGGYLKDSDWNAIHGAMGELAGLDFWVDDTPSISILEIRAKARRQMRNKEKGLIIVDYLQLMQPQNRRTENRQVEIAEISRGLKILAKELGMPIMALSQLSRAVEQRAGKRPMLSDLRESGAIEQDADVVMFIDRNTDPRGEEEEGRPQKGTAEIIIAKHRNGPLNNVPLVFLDRFTKFTSLSNDAE